SPAVPDLAVVVYGHGSPPELSLRNSVRTTPEPGRKSGDWYVGDWTSSWTPKEHADAVAQVREAIARGDVYQVNIVGHANAPYRGAPLAALRRVASLPGAKYGRILTGRSGQSGTRLGDGFGPRWAIATASPELLVRVTPEPVTPEAREAHLMIETRP